MQGFAYFCQDDNAPTRPSDATRLSRSIVAEVTRRSRQDDVTISATWAVAEGPRDRLPTTRMALPAPVAVCSREATTAPSVARATGRGYKLALAVLIVAI